MKVQNTSNEDSKSCKIYYYDMAAGACQVQDLKNNVCFVAPMKEYVRSNGPYIDQCHTKNHTSMLQI